MSEEYVSELEYQSHRPWCKARSLGRLNRAACNCDLAAISNQPSRASVPPSTLTLQVRLREIASELAPVYWIIPASDKVSRATLRLLMEELKTHAKALAALQTPPAQVSVERLGQAVTAFMDDGSPSGPDDFRMVSRSMMLGFAREVAALQTQPHTSEGLRERVRVAMNEVLDMNGGRRWDSEKAVSILLAALQTPGAHTPHPHEQNENADMSLGSTAGKSSDEGTPVAASKDAKLKPFEGVEKYYQRLFQQIKARREDAPPMGTGGDLDCLIAMVEWLWGKYRSQQRSSAEAQSRDQPEAEGPEGE